MALIKFILKRIYLYTIILLTISLVFTLVPFHYIHPEVRPYYEETMEIVNHYCEKDQINLPNRTTIGFINDRLQSNEDGDTEVATCYLLPGGWSIQFNANHWRRLSNDDRKQLVLHEMTHCLFKIGHVADPNHYMYYTTTKRVLTRSEVDEQFREVLLNVCLKSL